MRLDRFLVAKGLVTSRNRASRLIAAGRVKVDGKTITKAAFDVTSEQVSVVDEPYVSRSAYKLIAALDESGTQVPERVLDAGASTGGFTQVVLERGAKQVYAVDVGHGQLVKQLHDDVRVIVHEGLNLRDLEITHLDNEPVSLIVADVSFISLKLLLAPLLQVLSSEGVALLLVKPQFEVGRELLGAAGVVTDPKLQQRVVAEIITKANELGWSCDWQAKSALPGLNGNQEYFVRLKPRIQTK